MEMSVDVIMVFAIILLERAAEAVITAFITSIFRDVPQKARKRIMIA
jgi:hypothetical protein